MAILVFTVGVELLTPRTFTAAVAFTPAPAANPIAGLAGVAAEFGVSLPSGGSNVQSPQFYADLVRSQSFRERLLTRPFVVDTGGGAVSVELDTVLDVSGDIREEVITRTAQKLADVLNATVSPATGVVRVTARLPSGPLAAVVVERVMAQVLEFNTQTYQSRAKWERQFIEEQLALANEALARSEDKLAAFLVANREYARSPQLTFEADRLKRAVGLRQDVLSTLARSLEQAKIEEVKAEPVLTIVEPTRVSPLPDPRRLPLKAFLALCGGLAVAVVLLTGAEYFRVIALNDAVTAREFDALKAEVLGGLQMRFSQIRRIWGR